MGKTKYGVLHVSGFALEEVEPVGNIGPAIPGVIRQCGNCLYRELLYGHYPCSECFIPKHTRWKETR